MYAVLVGLIIGSASEEMHFHSIDYVFYLLAIVCCLVVLVLIRQDWVVRKDRAILLLILMVNALTIAAI
jgi:hypothetical protein